MAAGSRRIVRKPVRIKDGGGLKRATVFKTIVCVLCNEATVVPTKRTGRQPCPRCGTPRKMTPG